MNTERTIELRSALKEAWERHDKPTETKELVKMLVEVGVDPENFDDLSAFTGFIDQNAISLESGKDPEKLALEARLIAIKQEKEQNDAMRKQGVLDRFEEAANLIKDVEAKKDVVTVHDLLSPVRQLSNIAQDAASAYTPERVDSDALILCTEWSEVVERIKNKADALETSYMFKPLENGEPEPLRFSTGALSIIAAPTSHGKTTMLINILLDAVKQYPNKRHWLFSYEEDATSVIMKALNTYVGEELSKNNLRTIEHYLRHDDDQYFYSSDKAGLVRRFGAKLKEFKQLLESGRLNIRDANYSASDLITAIQIISKHEAGFVGIDYIGLLHDDRTSGMSRQEELKRIALGLKDCAIETKLPIIAAAQFNREVTSPEKMAAHRIAEASDIERAANKIIGMWNGSKSTNKGDRAPNEKEPIKRGITPMNVYIRVLKARDERSDFANIFDYNGNTGTIGKNGARESSRAATLHTQHGKNGVSHAELFGGTGAASDKQPEITASLLKETGLF